MYAVDFVNKVQRLLLHTDRGCKYTYLPLIIYLFFSEPVIPLFIKHSSSCKYKDQSEGSRAPDAGILLASKKAT